MGFADEKRRRLPWKRNMLAACGASIGLGFVVISAASNWQFAHGLAAHEHQAVVYGAIGILSTLANAYLPIAINRAWNARRYGAIFASLILLPFCVAFSLASAMGFAATTRDRGTADQAAQAANYQTTMRSLRDLEAQTPRTKQLQQKIEILRSEAKTYVTNGALKSADPQASALAALGLRDSQFFISLLFALLVEIGACVLLYVAFSSE